MIRIEKNGIPVAYIDSHYDYFARYLANEIANEDVNLHQMDVLKNNVSVIYPLPSNFKR